MTVTAHSIDPAPADRPASSVVELVVDQQDVIVAVGAGWNEAANEGNAPTLLVPKIIGRSLYDYVCGDETRMFVRTMLMGARYRAKPVVRPYRCDTPTQKRWMEMELHPGQNGQVRIVHRLLRVADLPSRVAPVAGSGSRLPKRCSHCNRLRLDGVWREPSTPTVVNFVARNGEMFGVIYGICPRCKVSEDIPVTVSGVKSNDPPASREGGG